MKLSFTYDNFRAAFGSYDRVTIENTDYKVQYSNEDGYILSHTNGSELSVSFTHERLSRLAAESRIKVERDYFRPDSARKRLKDGAARIADLTPAQLARVSKKDALCEAFLELQRHGQAKCTDEWIDANMKLIQATAMAYIGNLSGSDKTNVSADFRKAPSARTFRKWLKEKGRDGTLGLIDFMHRRGNRGSQMDPDARAILNKEIDGYLSPARPTVQTIFANLQSALWHVNKERADLGLVPFATPSRETVRRSIRELDPFSVHLARYGRDSARKKYRPVTTGVEPTRLLERVEIDEVTLDVISMMKSEKLYQFFTDEEKLQIGLDGSKARWTVTMAICCTSRCILGAVLSRNPSSEAAVKVLEMIVSNKGQWADAVGSLGNWDMFGLPELIVTDGGSAFKSQRFRNVCSDLGILFEIAINGVPELRGIIERFFAMLSKNLCARLEGRTFGDVIEKGDADPTKRAVLNLDDLTFALTRWMVDIYHNTPHKGLGGDTPLECWRRLSKSYGVCPPPDANTMRLVFGKPQERRLDKTGITVLGVKYHSGALAKWMTRRDPGNVEVRWHPANIGAIGVRLGAEWVTVPSVDAGLEGVPAQHWLTAVKRIRSSNTGAKSLELDAIYTAIKDINERTQDARANAGLNLEDWSGERIEREERKLFAGVEFFKPSVPSKTDDAPGRAIPDLDELSGQADTVVPPAGPARARSANRASPKKASFRIEEQ
jgi:putative transposase